MAIEDFLNDYQKNGYKKEEYTPSMADPDKSFIDNLVNMFAINYNIEKAYFGLLYNEEEDKDDLYLAVDHHGHNEAIKAIAEGVRYTYLPDRQVIYTSNVEDPELFSFIEQSNFAFYAKGKYLALNMLIMNYYLDPAGYQMHFMYQVRAGKLVSLFKDFDPSSNILNFQTFVRNGREFVPLFSEKDMIYKSGMTEVPADLTPLEFDWPSLASILDGIEKLNYYVLNPGTSFEVEFNV